MTNNIEHANFDAYEAYANLKDYEDEMKQKINEDFSKHTHRLGVTLAALTTATPVIAATATFGMPALVLLVPAIPIFFTTYGLTYGTCYKFYDTYKDDKTKEIKSIKLSLSKILRRESKPAEIKLDDLKKLILLDNGKYCKKQVQRMNFHQLRVLKILHGEVKFTKWISKYDTPEIELWKKIMSIPKSSESRDIVEEIKCKRFWENREVRYEVNIQLSKNKSLQSNCDEHDSDKRENKKISINGKLHQVNEIEFSKNCEGILKILIDKDNELTFTDEEDGTFAPLFIKFASGEPIEWDQNNFIKMIHFCNKYSQERLLKKLDQIAPEKYIQFFESFTYEDHHKIFFIPEMIHLRLEMLEWAERAITEESWEDFVWAAKQSNSKELTKICIESLVNQKNVDEQEFIKKLNYLHKSLVNNKNENPIFDSTEALDNFIYQCVTKRLSNKNVFSCFLIGKILKINKLKVQCLIKSSKKFNIIVACNFSDINSLSKIIKNISMFYANTSLSSSEQSSLRSLFYTSFDILYGTTLISKEDYKLYLSEIEKLVGKLGEDIEREWEEKRCQEEYYRFLHRY